jgi:hypothetical protein
MSALFFQSRWLHESLLREAVQLRDPHPGVPKLQMNGQIAHGTAVGRAGF